MRVSSITNYYGQNINTVKNNRIEKPLMSVYMTSPVDTVSFGRVAQNAGPLRELMELGLTDIWTGKPVLPKRIFEEMLQRKDFNRQIKYIISIIEPYKEALHDVPKEIFDMLSEYAKIKPTAHLDQIFQLWAPLAQRDLSKLQKPIFDELKNVAKKLPPNEKEAFFELMETTQSQIEKKPIIQPFNKRDFRYKLERIAQRIRQAKIPEEVKTMEKIIKISSAMPVSSKNHLALVKKNKFEKADRQTSEKLKSTFRQLKNFFERSVLRKDEELIALLADIHCQINGIPTFIPFGRINFIESLKYITKDMADQILARQLVQIATKLPTANQEASAFIVKSSRKPSEKIGYDLLWGSVGNIEHLDIYSKGGKDGPSNYAVSTNYTNSKRSNKSIAQQLRSNEEAYNGCKRYIEKLIEFANGGVLKRMGLNGAYVKNIATKLERKSPPEKPLKLDLTSLR